MPDLHSLVKQALICGLIAAWSATAATAGEPYLVADLDRSAVGSDPRSFVEFDGRVYFSALHPESGRELWTSDGTAEGTRIVKDIFPGDGSSEPIGPVVYDGRMFLTAKTEDYGRELWVSDGTAEGTVLFRDVEPGPGDGLPLQGLVAFDGRLFFVGETSEHGRELWSTDGTEDGTRLFLDAWPGGLSSAPHRLAASGDRLFFYARTPFEGTEPWVSDGTAEGTRMIVDLLPGIASSFFTSDSGFIGRDGSAFFSTSVAGLEGGLWLTDGTAEGTRRLDLGAASGLQDLQLRGLAGDRLIFTALGDNRLWVVTDATVESLASFTRTASFLGTGEEFFFFDDSELWRTDGTEAGTRPFLDQPFPGGPGYLAPMVFENGRLWFSQGQPNNGLWVSDGTAEATVRVKETARAFPTIASFRNGRLWFTDSDEAHGTEPWISDGTPDGTRMVRDIDDLSTGSFPFQNLEPIEPDRMLVFGREELWITDGTDSGTHRVPGSETLTRFRYREELAPIGGRVYFEAARSETDYEIWWTDGERVELLFAPAPDTAVLTLRAVGQRLIFASGDTEHLEIWSSDGDSVERLTDVEVGEILGDESLGVPRAAVVSVRALGDSAVIFGGWWNSRDGLEEVLWGTDGTAAGTHRIRRLSRFIDWPLAVLGDAVYFEQRGDPAPLWKTDGTAAGTVRVMEFPPEVRFLTRLETVGDRLAIVAYEGTTRTLWFSDGTAEGTAKFPFIGPAFGDIVATPGRLWVLSDGGSNGDFLYQLDADTLEIERLLYFDAPVDLTAFGGVVYYGIQRDRAPGELWRTDGTAEGTVPLGLPAPTLKPRSLGSRLYFPGVHPVVGEELWALDHDCVSSPETLCLAGDRFQARSLWRDRSGKASLGQTAELNGSAGSFWFFDRELPEVAVKVLDGRSLNGHFWAFSGGVTDLEVELHLLDVGTGAESRHVHPAGDLSSVADIQAFADSPAAGVRQVAATSGPGRVSISNRQTEPGICQANATTLCLLDGRFALSLERRTDGPAAGFVDPISDRAGGLSYFPGGSLEFLAKVHDGRSFNGHYWVFVGSLSDLAYDLTVTDILTGARRVYSNPPGRVGGFADIEAFGE